MRLNLATPIEDGIGYGLCGMNLAIELSLLADVNVTSYLANATIHSCSSRTRIRLISNYRNLVCPTACRSIDCSAGAKHNS